MPFFYSPQIANETWVMTLRYKYMLAINKYDWLKPILRAARKDSNDGLYRYVLLGRVEKDLYKMAAPISKGCYGFLINHAIPLGLGTS
jgi:hypothetical protein